MSKAISNGVWPTMVTPFKLLQALPDISFGIYECPYHGTEEVMPL